MTLLYAYLALIFIKIQSGFYENISWCKLIFLLTRVPSYASSMNKAAMMRKYASSPKLMTKDEPVKHHISVQNLGPLTSASSMLNLKAKKNSLEEHVNKHLPLKKNSSAPVPDTHPKDHVPRAPSSIIQKPKNSVTSAQSVNGIDEEILDVMGEDDVTTVQNDYDEDLEKESVIQSIRGSDIGKN